MKKVLGSLMAFALAFGVFGGVSAHKAEAAWTSKQKFTYDITVKKSDTVVNRINHQYGFEWSLPAGGGTLITDVYYRVKKDGNVELLRIEPSASLVWPFQLREKSAGRFKPYTGQVVSGYSKHVVTYSLSSTKWTDMIRESYNTDVKIVKGKPIDKNTTKLTMTFTTTGRDIRK